jgi:hypothetical protein
MDERACRAADSWLGLGSLRVQGGKGEFKPVQLELQGAKLYIRGADAPGKTPSKPVVLDVSKCTVGPPKTARKGHQHAFRLDAKVRRPCFTSHAGANKAADPGWPVPQLSRNGDKCKYIMSVVDAAQLKLCVCPAVFGILSPHFAASLSFVVRALRLLTDGLADDADGRSCFRQRTYEVSSIKYRTHQSI